MNSNIRAYVADIHLDGHVEAYITLWFESLWDEVRVPFSMKALNDVLAARAGGRPVGLRLEDGTVVGVEFT